MNIQPISFKGLGPGVKEMLEKRANKKGDNSYCNVNPDGESWGNERTFEDYQENVRTIEQSNNIHIRYSEKYGLCVYEKYSDDPNEGLKRIGELSSCDNSNKPSLNSDGVIQFRLQDVAKMAKIYK